LTGTCSKRSSEKTLKPAQKRELVAFLRVGFALSERRACRVLGLSRSVQRYRSVKDEQAGLRLRLRLRDLAATRVRYGYRRLHVLLRREGWPVNHKRVYRLYRLEGLALRRKTRKKRPRLPRVLGPAATRPHREWGMDFLSDRLVDGRRFRVLTLVDHVSRVSPAIAVDASLTGARVVTILEQVTATLGRPERIRVDNGPEFISKALDAWAYRSDVELVFSRPGKPTDNPFVEAFNSRFRDECLDQHWFASLEEARQTIEAWRVEYNGLRPHGALGQQTPAESAARWEREQDRSAE
jgi:putative transposase